MGHPCGDYRLVNINIFISKSFPRAKLANYWVQSVNNTLQKKLYIIQFRRVISRHFGGGDGRRRPKVARLIIDQFLPLIRNHFAVHYVIEIKNSNIIRLSHYFILFQIIQFCKQLYFNVNLIFVNGVSYGKLSRLLSHSTYLNERSGCFNSTKS